MTQRKRRDMIAALWGIQRAKSASDFTARLSRTAVTIGDDTLRFELMRIAGIADNDRQRDELEGLTSLYEMDLGIAAADRGIRLCAANRRAQRTDGSFALQL